MKKAYLVITMAAGLLPAAGCAEPESEGGEGAAPPAAEGGQAEAEAVGVSSQALSAGRVVICRGGSAPVSYWSPSGCGNVHDYYPQGWHGTFQTFAGCDNIASVYFHPNNGAHGGYIEEWRLCNY